MKKSNNNYFNRGGVNQFDTKNQTYFIPPTESQVLETTPPKQSSSDEVLKRQTIRKHKSKYQKD